MPLTIQERLKDLSQAAEQLREDLAEAIKLREEAEVSAFLEVELDKYFVLSYPETSSL